VKPAIPGHIVMLEIPSGAQSAAINEEIFSSANFSSV
jgi:hypothetical protein